MQIKLAKIGKSHSGTSQKGKPYTLLSFWLESEKYTGWANIFAGKGTEGWAAGQTVEVEDVVATEPFKRKDGTTGVSYNIVLPKAKPAEQNNDEVLNALRELYKLVKRVEAKLDAKLTEQAVDEINAEIDDTDFPFKV